MYLYLDRAPVTNTTLPAGLTAAEIDSAPGVKTNICNGNSTNFSVSNRMSSNY